MKPTTRPSPQETVPHWNKPAFWSTVGIAFMLAALPVSLAVSTGAILVIEAFWPDSMPTGALAWSVFLATGSPLLVFGTRFLNRARQLRAGVGTTDALNDTRAPVLYLRTFSDDAKLADAPELARINPLVVSTREENLVEALQGIGPVIAVGRPGESLPPLGAERIYIDDNAWQQKVIDLMQNAGLVVLMLGKGGGLWWEIEQALRRLPPQRLLFYGEAKAFPAFLTRAGPWLPSEVTMPRHRSLSLAPNEYLLSFEPDGAARFIRLKNSALLWRGNLQKPLLPVFHIALRPVFERLDIPWSPPPVPWRLLATIISLMLLLFGTITWLILIQA
ncbi:MAG: hypothetical protein P8103_17030 [Candidatus Thiodiazotropha sp.]